jgi:TetR/AcrR family tetracycline transcriptional repressor
LSGDGAPAGVALKQEGCELSATSQESLPVAERSPLSRDRIVDRALALAKEHGLAAVSMRRLAKELGVQPMSLYYHIPSRVVLMVLMAERSIAAVPQSDPGAIWDDQLVALMLDTYHAGVADPAVFPVLASETLGTRSLPATLAEAGAASVGLVDRVQALLAEAGVAESDRPGVCRALFGLVVGFLVGQVDGLVPTGGTASPESGSDIAMAGGDLDVDDQESVPPRLQAMHVDDPAVDLAKALRIFMRGLSDQRGR